MLGFNSTACSIFRILPWYSSTTSSAWSTTRFQCRQYLFLTDAIQSSTHRDLLAIGRAGKGPR